MTAVMDPDIVSEEIASFRIEMVRYVDADGSLLQPLPDGTRSTDELVAMYRAMVLTRTFDADIYVDTNDLTGRLLAVPLSGRVQSRLRR